METPLLNSQTDLDEVKAIKLRQVQLLRKKLELKKSFGLAFYKPHPKQDRFHRAGEFKRRMYRAGNRSGKSEAGCAEDCSWLLGHRPFYPVGDAARTAGIPQKPNKGLVITTDWDKVDEIWTSHRGDTPGKLWKMLPRGFVKSTHRNHSGAIDMVECTNGSMLYFDTVKSFLANPQGSESSHWDFIHGDEPLAEQMWKAAARGLVDNDGSAWFTLTALAEPWITDMFFGREKGQGKESNEIIQGKRKHLWAISGSIYDNPYLTKESIEAYASTLTEDEKQCRLLGIPLHLSGLVYKEFDHDTHVLKELPAGWTDFLTPPADYTLYFAIDPHPQTPHAVLFCWVSPFGQKFFCAEVFEHCSIRDLAQRVLALQGKYFVARSKCDPLGFINDPITETNMAEELAREGVYVEKATKALSQGILRVQHELKLPNNVYFGPHMQRSLFEFSRYVWDPKRPNHPVDKDDHMMENLYRLLLDDMTYVDNEKTPSNPTDEMDITHAEVEDDLVTANLDDV